MPAPDHQHIDGQLYTKEELAENKRKANEIKEYTTPEGKTYTTTGYNATQVQRKYEVKLRTLDERAKAFDSAGNATHARLLRRQRTQLKQEYKDISSQLGLSPKMDRVNSVLKSGNIGGIIKEQSKKPITFITDAAIKKVPNVEIAGFTREQNIIIQQKHKELLRYAKENNNSNEVAFVLNSQLNNLGIFEGTDDIIDFGNRLQGANLIILHNHPRNSSYSYSDIVEFITNENIQILTIVKNNGELEVLQKLLTYNMYSLGNELLRLERNNVKLGNNSEYAKIINKFIQKYDKKGIFKWIVQEI